MTPTRWLLVIAMAVTLISFSVARCRIDHSHWTARDSDSYTRPSIPPATGKTTTSSKATPRKQRSPKEALIAPDVSSAPSTRSDPRLPSISALEEPAPFLTATGDDGDHVTLVANPLQPVADTNPTVAARADDLPLPKIGSSTLLPVIETDYGMQPSLSHGTRAVELQETNEPGRNSSEPTCTMDPPSEPLDGVVPDDSDADLRTWWDQKVIGSLRGGAKPTPVGLADMILGALRHSPRVKAISNTPLIRETAIMESEGQFDWRAFMESRFTDTSDPVGSTLITGGPSRLNDQDWRYTSGLRRKLYTGGRFEVSQRIGLEDSNSQFFSPTNQAYSKLALNFTQPLLNGAGRAYNTSLILLAQIDTHAAHDEFSRQLQEHLLEVTRTYWELFLNRATLLQKRKVHSQALQILEELESRRGVDSLQSQIVRARAAVAIRQAEIARSEMAIRNTESKLRVLVNDPQWVPGDQIELLPTETPTSQVIQVNLVDSLATAMQHRPEIDQATQNVRAATVRLGISKQELKPVLDFVAEAYASGLEGDFALGKSYGDQLSEGRPSYSVGLVFEIPLCNREARARYQRRQLELNQLAHELQNVIETTKAEVEIAVRQVETSFQEMQSKYRAVSATNEEVQYLTERWRLLPGEDQASSFLLEDVLEAQQRLSDEENEFVTAQIAYTLSISELKRAMGTLLETEGVETTDAYEDGKLPLPLDTPTPTGH